MKEITLHKQWMIKAPIESVFEVIKTRRDTNSSHRRRTLEDEKWNATTVLLGRMYTQISICIYYIYELKKWEKNK